MDDKNKEPAAPSQREGRDREIGSFLAATIFGVPVRVHGMFSILILVFGGLAAATGSMEIALFLPAVLAVSAIHELGHTLAAKRLDYPVRSIVLHPFKGSSLVSHPERPRHEVGIALAGPAANLLTAALILALLTAAGKYPAGVGGMPGFLEGNLLGRFVFFNAFIALLNLVPVFPLDGGHALRGVFATTGMPRANATRAVVFVSYFTATACVTAGVVLANVYWILFAAMVTLGTTHQMGNDSLFSAIQDLTVKDVMQAEVRTLLLAQTLKSATDDDLPTTQRFFPVTCGDEVFGVLSRSSMEASLRSGKGSAYVAELMNRQMVFANPDEPLQTALERSRLSPGSPILVGEPENFLGMITLEIIQKRISLAAVK